MSATPFKGNLFIKHIKTGHNQPVGISVSDVNDALCTVTKGGRDFMQFKDDVYIQDGTFAAATSVTQLAFEWDGDEKGRVEFAGMLVSVPRPHLDRLGPIKAGTLISMRQIT